MESTEEGCACQNGVNMFDEFSPPPGKSSTTKRLRNTIATPLRHCTEYGPDGPVMPQAAGLVELGNAVPTEAADKTNRSPPTKTTTMSPGGPGNLKPNDSVSLDEALRLENNCLTKREFAGTQKKTQNFDTVFKYSSSRDNLSISIGGVNAGILDDLDDMDDDFVLSDPEDDFDCKKADFVVRSPRLASLLLDVRPPRSQRSIKFKAKLPPVQEYAEE